MSQTAEKLPYQLVTKGSCLIVRVEEMNEQKLALAISQDLISILATQKTNVVIEFNPETLLLQPLIRSLMQLRQSLAASQRQVRLVGLTRSKVSLLKQQGLEHALKTSPSIDEAIADLSKEKTHTLDTRFIEPFLTCPLSVLATQAATTAKHGHPFKKQVGEKLLGDISGVIGLVADAFTGSVVISFPEETFLKIMSRMVGEEYTSLTSEIQDGAGELTNIIFGQAKVILNERGYNIQTALPSVIVGGDHAVIASGRAPRIVVPFTSDAGPFFIEICLST
jgi:chemotaxis protein CheX